MRNPNSILITGASSGIGEGLARAYAAPGMHLFLTGRNLERLQQVAAACRAAGAEVLAEAVDSADRDAMGGFVERAHAVRPLDLVIANAGIAGASGRKGESADQARAIFAVNVEGVLNTILPSIQLMHEKERGDGGWRGQIAIMSSLAGFRGLPGAPAYCASKAAVKSLGESLRSEWRRRGIAVSVIHPGFVKSRITEDNTFPMPFLMETDKACAIIKKRLARNAGRIVFPWRLYAAVYVLNAMPAAWADWLLRRSPRKTPKRDPG